MNKIFSITIICLLLLIGSAVARNDMIGKIGYAQKWGDWGPWEFCPEGSYAAGYSMKVEPSQGDSDDTALNGIKLQCIRSNGEKVADITSNYGKWGKWGFGYAYCPNSYFHQVNLKIERELGDGDDTAANSVYFICLDGSLVQADGSAPWGDWWGLSKCPNRRMPNGKHLMSVVCGIRTRVERPLGDSDDTALNGAEFACCEYNPFY